MAARDISDMLSRLSLDSEIEDQVAFYLTTLRRKKVPYLLSKDALFMHDIDSSANWIYLQLRMMKDNFVWGCSSCTDIYAFRKLKDFEDIEKDYCKHAHVAVLMIGEDEIKKEMKKGDVTVDIISKTPYYAIAHAGKSPAVIHFPRQTKSANCTMHPGAHKAGKSKCEHLAVHETPLDNQVEGRVPAEKKRSDNPYGIKVNLVPNEAERAHYSNPNYKFPDNLVPNAGTKTCAAHGNLYCSRASAIDRYLVISEKVHIHDLLPVDDSRNKVCRVIFI